MAEEYIYAVARIKARETQLLTQQDIDRLMACRTPAECLRALGDKGWDTGSGKTAEAVLAEAGFAVLAPEEVYCVDPA